MGKNDSKARAGFADFARSSYEFEIISPDGESMIVEMRDVTAEALLDATRDLKPPDVPFKEPPEFDKDAEGKVVRRMDPDSPAYLKALMLFRQRQMAGQIVTVWDTDIPGETLDDKIASVLDLPSWAFSGLWKACEMVTATSEDRIKRRSFRPARKVEA